MSQFEAVCRARNVILTHLTCVVMELQLQNIFIDVLLSGHRVLSHVRRLQASIGAACHSELTHR